jgi:hypothetical protein
MHRQLEAIKSSMKKSDSEDVKMAEVSPEINKWIVAQADDVLRTGEAWKEYHDAIDKSLELEAQAKEQIQLANVHAMEAAGSISKLAAAQETAAIHAADYKAKIQALREELERLQKEEKDYEAQNAGLHNPKNLAQQQQVQNQITQVKGQADTSAVQDNAAITKQIEAPYIKAFDDINTAFVGFINEWMTTNKGFVRSMEDASRQMAVSMIDDIAKIELKKVEMWALNKLLGDQDDGTDEAQKRITSNSEVAESDAGVAAANAALMASPGGVWDAIAAGSIMYAAMTPWVAAASLDTGTGYVPRDGVAAIHQGEIIVPAPTADELRNGSGGRDITITQHNNITAANEKAIIAAIDRNPHAIAGALRRHLRQGGH